MLVFRIENKRGTGPYFNTLPLNIILPRWQTPEPENDGIFFLTEKQHSCHRYGFKSIRQCCLWFAGRWNDLDETGFFLSIYEVHPQHVVKGKKQVAFLRKESLLVMRIPIKDRKKAYSLLYE